VINKALLERIVFAWVILLLTAGCSAAGVNSPLAVGDVKLQITQVTWHDSYVIDEAEHRRTLTPQATTDTLMVVRAKIVSGTADVNLEVSVLDANGRTDKPTVITQSTSNGEETIEWLFAVSKSAPSYTLNFPDNKSIKLDSFLK
jgi:hypothetical protein